MNDKEKKGLGEFLEKNGIGVYIVIQLTSFLLKKVFDTIWGANIPVFIFASYVIYILVMVFSSKLKPILDFDKKLLLKNLLIIPFVIMLLVGSVCFSINQQGTGAIFEIILEWIKDNTVFLILIFMLIVTLEYCRIYEIIKLNEVNKGSAGKNIEQNDNLVEEDGERKKIDKLVDKVEKIEDILEYRRRMGYTVTCIPIKYNYDNNTFMFILIKNPSHLKAQWMFPGSHMEVSDNRLDDNLDLTEINIIPNNVIEDRVKNEAGLEGIKLIDPNYKYVNPNDSSEDGEVQYQYPNTCWPIKAPVFNYLFKVSDCAKCYTNHEHRCHYDFTYVGEYSTIDQNIAQYDVIEIQFNLSRLRLENEARRSDVSYIKERLEECINKKMRSTQANRKGKGVLNVSLKELCLDSIPQMIYNTILFYSEYKGIKKEE